MINIESMKIDKNNIYVNIIFISIFLIFLDAYEIFSIPISWIGLSFLLIPIVLEGKAIVNKGLIKNVKSLSSNQTKIVFLFYLTSVILSFTYTNTDYS